MKIQIAQQSETVQDISQISEPLDVPVSITPDPVPTVYKSQKDDDTIEEITINVPQPSKTTNLRVEQQRLQEIQDKVVADQKTLDEDTNLLLKQSALVDEMSGVADEAIASRQQIDSPSDPLAEVVP